MADKWETELRQAIRGANGPGWTARSGGPDTVQLIYRPAEPFEEAYRRGLATKQPAQYGRIQLPWAQRYSSQILDAVVTCGRMVGKGTHLSEACRIACGDTPIGPSLDWEVLVSKFKDHRIRVTGEVTERTWNQVAGPTLQKWCELVTGASAPSTAQMAYEQFSWGAPGSRSRLIKVQTISRFLSWSCNLGILGPEWDPPANKAFYGSKPKDEHRITGALTDDEIKELLDSTHRADWWWLLAAMSLYGLRPIEVFNLRFKGDELWCMYRKKSSGGITEPRRLYALEPFEGLEDRWLSRWGIQDRLPDLGRDKGTPAVNINIYLRRQKPWLKFQKLDEDRKLVPYSFRHAYALRGAGRGIPPRFMAAAMGHSLSTHLKSYSKFMDSQSMEDAFNRAR